MWCAHLRPLSWNLSSQLSCLCRERADYWISWWIPFMPQTLPWDKPTIWDLRLWSLEHHQLFQRSYSVSWPCCFTGHTWCRWTLISSGHSRGTHSDGKLLLFEVLTICYVVVLVCINKSPRCMTLCVCVCVCVCICACMILTTRCFLCLYSR